MKKKFVFKLAEKNLSLKGHPIVLVHPVCVNRLCRFLDIATNRNLTLSSTFESVGAYVRQYIYFNKQKAKVFDSLFFSYDSLMFLFLYGVSQFVFRICGL